MISENYIMNIVKDYAKSPEGKAAIKKQCGITYTDKNPSAELMKYGDQMKLVLYKHVNSLIKSITPDDITVQKPHQDSNGMWRLEISFIEGSLRRDSLDLENYSEGLSNIVLLFAKGYHAQNYVHGWWMTKNGNHGNVRSRKDRAGSDFLIQALNEFNNVYGKDMATAELLGDYKICSENRN